MVTAASVHDSLAAYDQVLRGDGVMYGDSAYAGVPLQEQMDRKVVDTVVVQKAGRGRTLNWTDRK